MKIDIDYNLLKCNKCGTQLAFDFFIEKEEVLMKGQFIKTGRKRTNVNYLYCPNCGTIECVDGETFAGNWKYK